MKKNEILTLYLDAPLQSWGYQSRFDRRTTYSCPTRSGIIGMIAAALGIARGDTARLAGFRTMGMITLTLRPESGYRVYGSRLMDFHTIGGGFDPKSQRGHMPRKASGGTPATVVSHREYLQDAKFGVLLTGPPDLLAEMVAALKNPRWGIFLGRKSCIPAMPVCQGLFADQYAATTHLEEISGWKVASVLYEAKNFTEGDGTLMDIPEDFENRCYAPRRVKSKDSLSDFETE